MVSHENSTQSAGQSADILLITTHRDDNVQGKLGLGLADILSRPVDCATFDEIEFIISDKIELLWNDKELSSYKKIILYGGVGRILRVAHPLAFALKARGQDVHTSGAEQFRGLDKLSQNIYFSVMGVPIPKTYFADPDRLIQKAGQVLGFPFVLKDILASRGERNYLIESQQDLEDKLGNMQTDRYIAQEYIKNEGDIRILISDQGSTFAFKKLSRPGTHLNNTSQGASAEKLDSIPERLLEYCELVISEFKSPLLGIDAIEKDGEYYFLEANLQPQILKGAFVEEKKHFLRSVLIQI